MKITLIQSKLYWEDAPANRKMFDEKLASLDSPTDIVVLPEMFSTGFSMNVEELAETMEGPTVKWMQEKAATQKFVICGSLIIKEENKYHNRFVWTEPSGKVYTYDKRHLFRMGEENDHYTAGQTRLIIEYMGWRICPMVCYDLRFPVWSRNQGDYDLLLYVANWPAARSYAWKQLLIARAIENQSYLVGLNRVGEDGNGMKHEGDSCILSPKGEMLYTKGDSQEDIFSYDLDLESLQQFRKDFPVAMDADGFSIRN